jgi:HEAT repeat protein
MGNIVPQVLELLKDKDEDVRSPAADALGDLAKHSKVFRVLFSWTRFEFFEAVFHDSVETSVPVIAGALKDSDRNVRLASIHAISKLAEQGTLIFPPACYNPDYRI